MARPREGTRGRGGEGGGAGNLPGVFAVTKTKEGEAEISKAVGIVELFAPDISPKLGRILGQVSLTGGRSDKDDKRSLQQVCLVFSQISFQVV